MAPDPDRYEAWYSESLWQLLPAVYRAADSETFDENGPLRELVNRIGAQISVVRRSIDRIREDQSIETCDDWVIPYIGELVAARLVGSLDARGQRLQVAKAIYYRRREGTVAILEEAAHDVTGWDVRVVEFFRRLARTEHLLDPALGLPAETDDPDGARRLQVAQHRAGPATRTPAGGWADLRNVYGASRAQRAFDEFHHTADLRAGHEQTGWQNIAHLGLFVWRLHSFPESADDPDGLLTTPVEGTGLCAAHYTFDPTGRDVPLFATASRTGESYGARWKSPEEWQLPAPIDAPLFELDRTFDPHLYAHLAEGALDTASAGVYRQSASTLVPLPELTVRPERGRFRVLQPPAHDNVLTLHHYGSAARLGAGAYDRRLTAYPLAPAPGSDESVTGGGSNFKAKLTALAQTGTITINDSRTYDDVADVGSTATPITSVTLRSDNSKRPLVRLAAPREWRFTGGGNDAALHLEGIFVSGADVVLAGDFREVTISFCTFDPGDHGSSSLFGMSIDGRELVPSRLFIEGSVATLRIEASIAGPIRTRGSGEVELLEIDGSVVQAIPATRFDTVLSPSDVFDLSGLLLALRAPVERVGQTLAASLSGSSTSTLLKNYNGGAVPANLETAFFADLDARLPVLNLNEPPAAPVQGRRRAVLPPGPSRAPVNRRLLAQLFPLSLADAAIALASGEVRIVRSTILGQGFVHRIDVSESILDDVFMVEDPQHDCVRFSAWTTGSVLPRKYESVEIAPAAPIFTSRVFAQPGYVQLRRDADLAIRRGTKSIAAGSSIREGAENGSEMGACYPEMNAIRERSLLLKLKELMPFALVPVFIPVT